MRSAARQLRDLRKERSLTMRDVASAISVPLTTYREWEYGRAIRGEHLMKLAKFFCVLPEVLVGCNLQNGLTSEQRLARALEDIQIVRSELLKSQNK